MAAQRQADYQSLVQKQSEEYSSERGLAGPGHTDAAVAAVDRFKKIVESLPPALAPQYAQNMEQVLAFISRVSADAQRWSKDFPPMGHRPAGTEGACADLAEEGRAEQMAKFTANFVPTQIGNMYDALYRAMAVDTDDESVAPSEGGEAGRAAKKARKTAARMEKKESRKSKVLAKFSKA